MVTDKLEDFPIFSGAGKSTMKILQDKLDQYLCNIASVLRIKVPNEIAYHPEVLYAMFDRVEMRRIYFHVFHNGRAEVMSELMYAFQYRDLSKEALMILAKSLIRNK
jgi:hypothetical protein